MYHTTNRYKIDKFYSKSLENNPLGSPVNRKINIYLPPGYYEDEKRKYPVIYFLHGYSENDKSWTINSANSQDKSIDWNQVPKKFLERIALDKLLTFEKLDNLITEEELTPFILVQPDGSLEIPNIHKRKDFNGKIMTKGSFYVNSPYSGNYMNYIIEDVITYIDSNYRTIPKKEDRAIIGGSMGGYGALYLSIHHPEKFIATVALSPGNPCDLELLNWKLKIPIYTEIFGNKLSEQIGEFAWNDIMDTYDLLFSNTTRLLPSIRRNEQGDIIEYNKESYQNWQKFDLISIINENPELLMNLHLQLNCDINDEFGLAKVAEEIHLRLLTFDISHEYELYSDPKASLTPHALGIGYRILPGIIFCLKFIK
jgi:S-formylglutathione hydrolase FrmB